MSDTTEVNGQITDAVTQSNLEILGIAPAQALATVYMTTAQAAGISIQNATAVQQQAYPLNETLTAQAVNLLFNTGPASAARETRQLLSGNPLAQYLAQAQALLSTGKQILTTTGTPPVGGMPGAGRS
jgi:hypothetical protein